MFKNTDNFLHAVTLPKLSFVIPFKDNFDFSKFDKKLITTFKEVVFVDCNSIASAELINQIHESSFKYIKLPEKNLSYTKALLLALSFVESDYIMSFDVDYSLSKDFILNLEKYLANSFFSVDKNLSLSLPVTNGINTNFISKSLIFNKYSLLNINLPSNLRENEEVIYINFYLFCLNYGSTVNLLYFLKPAKKLLYKSNYIFNFMQFLELNPQLNLNKGIYLKAPIITNKTPLSKNFIKILKETYITLDKIKRQNKVFIVNKNFNLYKDFLGFFASFKAFHIKKKTGFGKYKSPEKLVAYLQKKSFTHCLFFNPYGNEKTLALYKAVEHSSVAPLVLERGALPKSWYLDNFFAIESPLYEESYWNKKLSKEEEINIENYLDDLRKGGSHLEKNDNFVANEDLRKKFNLREKDKIVFIPLQVETDTTVRFFYKDGFSYGSFLELIQNLAEKLKNTDYKILLKKHPLTLKLNQDFGSNIILIEDNTNVHSLLNLADQVVVFNTGVGLLALAHNKPVINYGKTFYSSGGLTAEENDLDKITNFILKADFKPSYEKIQRFFHYLLNDLYSFCNSKTRLKAIDKNNSLTFTDSSDFFLINIPVFKKVTKNKTIFHLHEIDFGSSFKNTTFLFKLLNRVDSYKIQKELYIDLPSFIKSQIKYVFYLAYLKSYLYILNLLH